MTIWFTSDHHFSHSNIIKYSKRPFTTVREMDEGLISNWNERVKPEDTVYHLGDVAFCSQRYLTQVLDRLNGAKILIYGNHDKVIKKNEFLQKKFLKCVDYLELKVLDPEVPGGIQGIVLCHFPMLSWNQMYRGSWMLHGHSHGNLKYPFKGKILDVGVDPQGYYPISYEEIKNKFKNTESEYLDQPNETS